MVSAGRSQPRSHSAENDVRNAARAALVFPLIYCFLVVILSSFAWLWQQAPAALHAWYRCPFKTLTGLPCPTCGTTRMLSAVAQLHWITALAMNPLIFGAFFFPFIWLLAAGLDWAFGLNLVSSFTASKWFTMLLKRFIPVLFLANWLYLMLSHR